MRRLVYTGRVTRRTLGPADGLSTTVTFVRGEPLAVSDADADLIVSLVPHQFAVVEDAPFPHTPPPKRRTRPAKGTTPEPEEG